MSEELKQEVLEDGQVKVCLERDGITVCCTVSSSHLVDEKRGQLEAAIDREARAAFKTD